MRLCSKPQKHKTTFTHLRKPTEPYIRKNDSVSMQESGFTYLRQAVDPQTRKSTKKVKRKNARNRRGPLTYRGSYNAPPQGEASGRRSVALAARPDQIVRAVLALH